MSLTELKILVDMLRRLTDLLDSANLPYHITGGTLIGSWRHHGLVPWDDDIDVYCSLNDREAVESLLQQRLVPLGYKAFRRTTITKLFPTGRRSKPIPSWKWRYPFIDICYYNENESTLWDTETKYFSKFRFPVSMVFPLRRRPFMDMMLWAPRQTEKYLSLTYGNLSICKTHHYSHRLEHGIGRKVSSIDCRLLWNVYPFVFRHLESEPANDSVQVVEHLKMGNRVISTFHIPVES